MFNCLISGATISSLFSFSSCDPEVFELSISVDISLGGLGGTIFLQFR